jgi:hypothetical protein
MTDQTDPGSGPADTVQELTGREDGVWSVVTRTSAYRFDFTAGTVTRVPGPNARPGVNDVPRPLKRIDEFRVGERGYWTMHSDVWEIDCYWQYSSLISRIERVVDPSTPRSVDPQRQSEY